MTAQLQIKIPSNLRDIHQSMIGRPKSDSIKSKISATLAGRKQSLETREKRRQTMLAIMRSKREKRMAQ